MYFVFDDHDNRLEGMSKEQILSAIEQGLEQGYVSDPEGAVISKIKEINANGTAQLWIGTEAQFNALSPAPSIGKSIIRIGADGVLYICTDDSSIDTLIESISPADIGAAAQTIPATVTLSLSGWSSNKQTVSVNGVTVNSNVVVSPAPASFAAYGEAGVYCSAQASGKLTFTCTDTPSAALTVNILIVG